jgi:hypothetical protein
LLSDARVQLKESMMMTSPILPRRAFLRGLAGLFAAPAVVKADILMPIKVWRPTLITRLGSIGDDNYPVGRWVLLNGARIKPAEFPDLYEHTVRIGTPGRLPENGNWISELAKRRTQPYVDSIVDGAGHVVVPREVAPPDGEPMPPAPHMIGEHVYFDDWEYSDWRAQREPQDYPEWEVGRGMRPTGFEAEFDRAICAISRAIVGDHF